MVYSKTLTASSCQRCLQKWGFCHTKEDAYRSVNKIVYNQARNTLTEEIRLAKRSYS